MVRLENLGETALMCDRVYDVLKREILKGSFKPGDTLNIVSLSRQLNVSNGPVREALNMLSRDGLVVLTPYKKATVAKGSEDEYKTVYDLRIFLEPYAAKDSADRIPEEEITAMRGLLDAVLRDPEDRRLYLESDVKFHEMIYKHSESDLLVSVLDSVRTYTMRYYAEIMEKLFAESGSPADAIRETTLDHLRMLELAAAHDGEALAKALREHIQHAYFQDAAQAAAGQD